MKTNQKIKLISLFAFMFIFATSGFAQRGQGGQGRYNRGNNQGRNIENRTQNVERMKERQKVVQTQKVDFIKEYLELTEKEFTDFNKIYTESIEKQREMRNSFRKEMAPFYKKKWNELTEKEADKMLEIEKKHHQNMMKLRDDEIAKYKNVMPTNKVAKIKEAEREFKRNMVRNASKRGARGERRMAPPLDMNEE